MKKKKKTLKEAGNYNNLTPEEKQLLSSAAPEIRNSLATVVSSMRRKGKQINLVQAAQQMQQIPHFSSDPNLAKFVSLAGLQGTKPKQNPFQSPMNVPKPPQFNQQAQQRAAMVPQQQGPTPGDQFEQLRTSTNTNNDDVIAQQSQPQQSDFQRQLQARQSRGAVNPTAQTQMAPAAMLPQQQQVARKRFPKPVAEAVNPAAMTGSLRNILTMLGKLKPDELMAVAQMVNNLTASKQNSMGMGTTMENKAFLTETIKLKLVEQVQARNTAEKLLTEGPLGNIWDKIKGAGTAVGQQMGVLGQAGQAAQNVGVDENSKRAAQELTKLIGKVNQHRQKFNSSILKNSETMNSYHDLVLNAVQAYNQTQHILGPFGQQIVRQIHDAVGNLVYDLRSEKEQIDMFLKQLKDAGMAKVGGNAMTKGPGKMDATQLGNAAKRKANASRVEENPGGTASFRRHMPMGGATPRGGKALDDEMMQRASDDFQSAMGPYSQQGQGQYQDFYKDFVSSFKNKKKVGTKKASSKKKSSGKK